MMSKAVKLARRELGSQLAELRRRRHYSTQKQLADALKYSRSNVANAEVGIGAAREFWEKADQFSGAHGALITRFDEIKMLEANREQEDMDSQAAWPLLAGVVPLVADRHQDREVADSALIWLRSPGRHRRLPGCCCLGGIGKTQIAAHHAHALWQAGELELLVG